MSNEEFIRSESIEKVITRNAVYKLRSERTIQEWNEIVDFLEGLTDQELMNTQVLLALPNALETIGNCPDPKYRDMLLRIHNMIHRTQEN